MTTKKAPAKARKATTTKDGAQSARAQGIIDSIEATSKQVPEIAGAANVARLSRRQLVPLVTVAQDYFDASAVALANWPELKASSKADPAIVRENIRTLTALEGVVTAAHALAEQVQAASERGWAATVQQCDRIFGIAKALLHNEEDPKRAEKLGKLVDAMKKGRKTRRHQAKARKARAAKTHGATTNGSTQKLVRQVEKQTTTEKSTETQS